ncbi:stabilizer of axonemal microtubules 5-like [Babylonia areolata]|uniref:stabilizer of axonemal microtubules 5-like n=1 Tax=Babylonia areolata TaxID=304850 RepID=UPI003FD26839
MTTTSSSKPSHLGPNNFTIGHDHRVTKPSLMSIFKNDYPVHEQYGRADIAKPPRLGDVMHKDERVSERASETVTSYIYRPMAKPVLMDCQNTLRVTNFKMDRDLSKVDSFATTHDHYFQPKYEAQNKKTAKGATTHMSHIPQGDMEKADAPLTNYSENFLGHDPLKHPLIKAPSMHHGGDPTIKGDRRLGHYDTSHTDQFQGTWGAAPATLPAPTGTNVPMGDQDKERIGDTTMKSSFVDQSVKDFTPFDSSAVSQKLRKTNFKLQDGHGEWDDYRSVAAISYPSKFDKTERVGPAKHRNQSDFPVGDRDPSREVERMSSTNYRYYMGNPALGLHNSIVSGANLRTRSNVWFGEPVQGKKFYSTTTADTFDPKSVPYSYNRENLMQKSVVPLDYYKGDVSHETTMGKDYQNPSVPRMIPHEAGMNRIKNSHIFPPLSGKTHFNTTHNDMFTPKTSDKYFFDSGRMQKSSVPLGTFT